MSPHIGLRVDALLFLSVLLVLLCCSWVELI